MEVATNILGLWFLTDRANLPETFDASYSPGLVLLSYAFACCGAYVGLTSTQQVAAARAAWERWLWLAAGAFAMGGGVWSMHFVGMLAYSLPFKVSYDIALTALSIAPSIAASAIALATLSKPRVLPTRLIVGGLLMAVGIGAMHFIGMAAMRANASMAYDPILFVLSILVAAVLACLALFVRVRSEQLRTPLPSVWANLLGALFMGLAITGMHYVAMSAAFIYPGDTCLATGPAIDGQTLANAQDIFIVLVVAILITALITRKRRTNAALLKAIFASSMDGQIVTDGRGVITMFSPAAERIFGYAAAEVVGRDILVLAPERGHDSHRERLASYGIVADDDAVDQNREVIALNKDGMEFPIEISVVQIVMGREVMFSATVRDITARKRAEVELHFAREAAVAANKAKSQFLATMSHEIRTPLNGVIGMVDLVLQGKTTDDQRRMLSTANESALALMAVINDILDFSKIEADKLELERIDVSFLDVAEGVAETLLPIARDKKVDLVLYIDPNVPAWVTGDPARLRQILFNLAGNAVKFSSRKDGKRGEVCIRLDLLQRENDEVKVRFAVSDNGIGMSEQVRRSLFRPFGQADASTTRRFGGTGLGLAISKSLVDRMGGVIGVESTEGEGSTFSVTLPFVAVQRTDGPLNDIDVEGMRVLSMARTPVAVEALRAYFKHVNADADFVHSLSEVEPLARQAAEAGRPYGIVVLDTFGQDEDPRKLMEEMRAQPLLAKQRYLLLETDRSKKCGLVSQDTFVVESRPTLLSSFLRAFGILIGKYSPLPEASDNSSLASDAAPLTIDEAERAGILILLAEDHVVNQQVIVRQLNLLGHAVEVAGDGAIALEMLEKRTYGLLLTDCHMPNLDGFELTQAIREREGDKEQRLPIIAITANALMGESERCLAAGMDGYLTKPVKLVRLRDTLASWLPRSELTPRRTRKAR